MTILIPPNAENPYARIDIRNIRLDDTPRDQKQKSVNYLQSETFFTEVRRSALLIHHTNHGIQVFESVCEQMSNYSTFDRWNVTRYLRYQRRPGQKGPLNLTGFHWGGLDVDCLHICSYSIAVDSQKALRQACDEILEEGDEQIMAYYQHGKVDGPPHEIICNSACFNYFELFLITFAQSSASRLRRRPTRFARKSA